jgi:glycolate oxidase FAD binding subunit
VTAPERLAREFGTEVMVSARSGGSVEAAPRSEDAALALIQWALRERVTLRPEGGGFGGPRGLPSFLPARAPEIVLSSRLMTALLDHSSPDLTVRVQPGLRLSTLAEALVPFGQWFPVDPPGGGARTVGGVVALGVSGPLAHGLGRIRDHVLGGTLLSGRGERLPLGGRVVKNVAGFDLLRLVSGSRGRLGFVTELTLRLFPLPAVDRTLVWYRDRPEAVESAFEMLRALKLPAVALEIVERETAVAIRLQGRDDSVRSLVRRVSDTLGAPDSVLDGTSGAAQWMRWTELSWAELLRAPAAATREGVDPVRARLLEGVLRVFDPAGIFSGDPHGAGAAAPAPGGWTGGAS